MILLLDNYDSFVHNLARYFRLSGQEVLTVRNDHWTVDQVGQAIDEERIQGVVMSPGPCTPNEAGICLEVVQRFWNRIPMLGVCLGHQVIAQAMGGQVIAWEQPIHGLSDEIFHDQQHEFSSIPSPFRAGRYHSLTVRSESFPSCLQVSAWLDDGTIMGIRHRQQPLYGFQFHPESILTDFGLELLGGFLRESALDRSPVTDPSDARPADQRFCELPPGSQRSRSGALEVEGPGA